MQHQDHGQDRVVISLGEVPKRRLPLVGTVNCGPEKQTGATATEERPSLEERQLQAMLDVVQRHRAEDAVAAEAELTEPEDDLHGLMAQVERGLDDHTLQCVHAREVIDLLRAHADAVPGTDAARLFAGWADGLETRWPW